MINPDGVRHQIHGNVIQSTSRALMEEVSFDRNAVTSREWGAYPIITFPDVPEIDVLMLPRPDQPPLGSASPPRCRVPRRSPMRSSTRPACGFANRRSRRNAFWRDCAASTVTASALPGPPRRAAASSRPLAQSVCATARRLCGRRGTFARRCRHRRGGVAVAIDRADRAAGSVGLFGRNDRARPATRRARRLRGLPYRRTAFSMPAAGRSRRRSASSTAPTSRPMPRPASAHGPIRPSSARCARASTATAGISIRHFPTRILPRPPTPTCRRSMPS